jgi:peptidyl-prolyl cis-trans isomerase SurA
MKEFAGRANMTTEQFVAALAKAGVAEQTYRAFVRAGVAWRNLVRSKFGAELTVSDADVNRALSLAAQPREPRLLLSEILLPATPQYFAQSAALAEQLAHTVTTPAQFAAAARQYSGSQSAARGGRIDWVASPRASPRAR